MAFSSNTAIWEDDGQVEITTGTPGTVADGALSVAGDVTDNTNTVRAIVASFVLTATFATAPDVGGWLELISRQIDIVGTTDADVPDTNYVETVLGRFRVNDHTSAQSVPLGPVALPAVKEAQITQYYIRNKAGFIMSSGWKLHKTNFAMIPKA